MDIYQRISKVTVNNVILVIVCVILVYLLRARERFDMHPHWRVDLDPKMYHNGKFPLEDEQLPLPKVTDLDGDGTADVVVITPHMKLQVLVCPVTDRTERATTLPTLAIKESIDLPLVAGEDGKLSYPIAMETGFVKKIQSVAEIRTQVVVVVMDTWEVLCYTADLKLLWKKTLMNVGVLRREYFMKSVALHVTSHQLSRNDYGTIILGGSFGLKTPGNQRYGIHRHMAPLSGGAWQQSDPNTHFSTFALSGRNGTVRWHHNQSDFMQTHKERDLREFHHWKLGLQKHVMHKGEVHWSKYGKQMLKHLPHIWTDASNTKITLAKIRKEDKKEAPKPHTLAYLILEGQHIAGYAYGGLKPHSCDEHIDNPNAIIVHHPSGVEVMNLRTGQPLTHLELPEENTAYVDVNEDGSVEQIRVAIDQQVCSAVVTQLHPAPVLLFSGNLCSYPGWTGSSLSVSMFPDKIVSEDPWIALPPTVLKSVAFRTGPLHHLMGRSFTHHRDGYDSVYLLNTGRMTSYGPNGEFNWQVSLPVDWSQVYRKATINLDRKRLYDMSFKPSVTVFSPQVFGKETAAVVLGWDNMALVDLKDGYVMAYHSLPCQPHRLPIIADFTGDGWNDVVVSCPQSYIGMEITSKPNYIYMGFVSVAVVLGTLLLTWCFRPDVIRREFEGADSNAKS